MPCLSYCVEIWGNTYKTNLQPLCTLQKRAIRIINNVGYLEHTHSLFLKSHTLKFTDLVTFKTAQIMYRARHNLLPRKWQTLFIDREGGYNLRGNLHLKQLKVRTSVRSMSRTICGVIWWNGLEQEFKQSTHIIHFKRMYRNTFLENYENDLRWLKMRNDCKCMYKCKYVSRNNLQTWFQG